MEIKITSQQILKVLYILAWIIFLGVCFEAGAFIVNAVLLFTVSPDNHKHLWQPVNLSSLFYYDRGYYLIIIFITSLVAVMKAILFYLIIKILHGKKLNMAQPFNAAVGRFIFRLSYLALVIGLFCNVGVNYTTWLISKGVQMPNIQSMHLGGADVWLFMGVVLLIIAQIFKRGIEIQTENELTV